MALEKTGDEKLNTRSTKILSADEMVDLIYKGGNLPVDGRFLDPKKGGVFKYFDIKTLNSNHIPRSDLNFPVVFEDDQIVGVCCLQKDPFKDNNYWITGISVDPKYQGTGYGRRLCEVTIDFAKEKGVSLEPSTYREEGEIKLKPILEDLAQKNGVILIGRKR